MTMDKSDTDMTDLSDMTNMEDDGDTVSNASTHTFDSDDWNDDDNSKQIFDGEQFSAVKDSLVRTEEALDKIFDKYEGLARDFKHARLGQLDLLNQTKLEEALTLTAEQTERLDKRRTEVEQEVKHATEAIEKFEQRVADFTSLVEELFPTSDADLLPASVAELLAANE